MFNFFETCIDCAIFRIILISQKKLFLYLEVDMSNTIMLGRVSILDDIVRVGQLLLHKVKRNTLRVHGRASKEGVVREGTFADT